MSEIATFGAGCFWGVEMAFANLPGVRSTTVGYAGGWLDRPSYRDVCGGNTGHAEVVRVEYEPDRVSFEDLLETFWSCHDPTQLNRQGPDVGFQYRSVIFCELEGQHAIAEASKERIQRSGRHSKPVVTSIEAAGKFFRAEEYHQKYLAKRGLATCAV